MPGAAPRPSGCAPNWGCTGTARARRPASAPANRFTPPVRDRGLCAGRRARTQPWRQPARETAHRAGDQRSNDLGDDERDTRRGARPAKVSNRVRASVTRSEAQSGCHGDRVRRPASGQLGPAGYACVRSPARSRPAAGQQPAAGAPSGLSPSGWAQSSRSAAPSLSRWVLPPLLGGASGWPRPPLPSASPPPAAARS